MPVYKIIAVDHDAFGASTATERIPGYAEIVGIELVSQFLQDLLQVVGSSQSLVGLVTDAESQNEWQQGVRTSIRDVETRRQTLLEKIELVSAIVERTQTAEQILAQQIDRQFAANLVTSGGRN